MHLLNTHVWDFQRAATVYVIDRARSTRRFDRSDQTPNRPRRPPSRSTSRLTMNVLMHFLFDQKRGRRRGRRRGRLCPDLMSRPLERFTVIQSTSMLIWFWLPVDSLSGKSYCSATINHNHKTVIHDHLFNTKQFWTTVRVLTWPRTMHRQLLNKKSFGPFGPWQPAGLIVQARSGPRAARPVTIFSSS